MKNKNRFPILALSTLIILLIGASLFYFLSKNNLTQQSPEVLATSPVKTIENNITETTPAPELSAQTQSISAPDTNANEIPNESIIATKIAEPATPKETLPTLYESDPLVLSSALALSSANDYSKSLEKVDVLHSFIIFTDHLAQGQVISNFSPFIKPEQTFSTYNEQGVIYLNTESYQRYDVYANIIEQLDIDAVVKQYKRFLPLIDADYQELGNAKGTFTETLILAIDNINETPVIESKIELIAPSAMYQFKDSHLENLNDAQKLMIRVGPKNLKTIQRKLTQLKIKLN